MTNFASNDWLFYNPWNACKTLTITLDKRREMANTAGQVRNINSFTKISAALNSNSQMNQTTVEAMNLLLSHVFVLKDMPKKVVQSPHPVHNESCSTHKETRKTANYWRCFLARVWSCCAQCVAQQSGTEGLPSKDTTMPTLSVPCMQLQRSYDGCSGRVSWQNCRSETYII